MDKAKVELLITLSNNTSHRGNLMALLGKYFKNTKWVVNSGTTLSQDLQRDGITMRQQYQQVQEGIIRIQKQA